MTDFSLSGVTIVKCGVQGANIGFRKGVLSFPYFALHISEGVNVRLSFLFITNSTQIGLLCINLWGTSGIHDSVITHSNYRLLGRYMQGEVECLEDDRECWGCNMWVMFFNPLMKVASNISKFIVERTKIFYGVNLKPTDSRFSGGAGALVHLTPSLKYDVKITIAKCHFMNNINEVAAHLYLQLFSSCTVLVEDSNFTHANRITEGDPMELVPGVHSYSRPLMLNINDGDRAAINVQIVMKKVHIAENVGGALHVPLLPQLSQSYIQLGLNEIEIVHNFLIQHTDVRVCDFNINSYVVRFEELMTNAGRVNT